MLPIQYGTRTTRMPLVWRNDDGPSWPHTDALLDRHEADAADRSWFAEHHIADLVSAALASQGQYDSSRSSRPSSSPSRWLALASETVVVLSNVPLTLSGSDRQDQGKCSSPQ